MFLLSKIYYICYYFVAWDHWRFYEDFIHVTCAPRSLCFQKKRYFSNGYFYLWNIFSKEILEDIFLKNIFFNIFLKEYLIQIYVWPEGRFNCANIFLEGILEIYIWRIICFNIFLRRIFDSNICCCWRIYKEDSDPSFIHQINVIKLSLLGFYC